ncbi:PIN domain-containing protein [Scytonema hofmannii FACHB-248]|uniref:PIN domain-containing protein n=1 Tax=Scytonema hofmannii FACHB-248 TaxID=1842502 RepID=A0ABR8GZ99_9CYAN|nr:PIN domain-containing protein [Scytonema hofmannii]MBD2608484.1 PIN domain-containing protein [Scytonema hofmannii FACHB-248]
MKRNCWNWWGSNEPQRTQRNLRRIPSAFPLALVVVRKQYKLRLPDAIIAATAQRLNAMLFTNDVRFNNVTQINTQTVQIV